MARRILVLTAALVLAVHARASLETHVNEPMAYRLDLPSGWVVQQSPDHLYLNVQPPEGSPEFGRVAIELAVEPSYPHTLDQGIDELLGSLRLGIPDLREQSRTPASVTGVPASVVDIRGTLMGKDVTYRLVFVHHGQRIYVLFLEALTEDFASYAPLFERVFGSFTLTDVHAPHPVAPPRLTDPALPDVPSVPSPLPGTTFEPHFGGTFVGDQLTLTLEAVLGVHYVGTLQHGEQRYPVTAQWIAGRLEGTFESEGHDFGFSATLERDALTFVTGGTSFQLTRAGPAPTDEPCNPLVPGSCTETQPPPAEPPETEARTAPEVPVADYTYFEAFDGTDPEVVFEGFLTVGSHGAWTGVLTGRDYRLTNSTAPSAVRICYLMSLPDGTTRDLSQGTLHVDVSIEAIHDASYGVGAGMLFDYDPDDRSYLAFVLSDTGYALYVRDEDGLGEIMSGSSDAIRPGSNRLTMHASGADIRLEVNGAHLASVSFGRPAEGGIGIIALGAGTFSFTGFTYRTP